MSTTIEVGLWGGGRMQISPQLDVSQVTPEVLAFGLSHVSRFGGQYGPWSVGEHSVRMYYWAEHDRQDKAVKRAMLIHDAPECLGEGDHQFWVKKLYPAESLVEYARLVTEALWKEFRPAGRPLDAWPWSAVKAHVKYYDGFIGTVEAREHGAPHDPLPEWLTVPGSVLPGITPWTPQETQMRFLAAWEASE